MMKRAMTILVVLLSTLGMAWAATAAAAPRAALTHLSCVKALDPTSRMISVTAVMRPVTGTKKMEVEAQLLSRAAGAGSFAPVTVPAPSKLDTWVTAPGTLGSRPGDVWKPTFPVTDLAAPAAYRYVVEFRWLGSGATVLQTVQRTSAPCRQPELRPDLYVSTFTVQSIAGHPKSDAYTAVIGNNGITAAKGFEVEFSDGTTAKTVQVAHLGPHAEKTLTFNGPACLSTDAPTLTLDPEHVVDDLNPANNTATATCPAPPAAEPTGS